MANSKSPLDTAESVLKGVTALIIIVGSIFFAPTPEELKIRNDAYELEYLLEDDFSQFMSELRLAYFERPSNGDERVIYIKRRLGECGTSYGYRENIIDPEYYKEQYIKNKGKISIEEYRVEYKRLLNKYFKEGTFFSKFKCGWELFD